MTNIEWTEQTWNPIGGCKVVSPGCTNCYAMRDAYRLSMNPLTPKYQGLSTMVNGKPVWTGKVRLFKHKLEQPAGWRKPRMIFVNSMSDLFYEEIPDKWIDRIFAVMELNDRHTYQILTKRPERMRDYVRKRY